MADATRLFEPTRTADGPHLADVTTDLAATTAHSDAVAGETKTFDLGEATAAKMPLIGDRYRVLRAHQAGGLGRVWLARDTAVGRDVALKTIRAERSGHHGTRQRFLREARITGRLEHPGIVPLYDVGPIDSPYYVMRFVAGRTLAEAISDYHCRRAAGEAGPLELSALLDAFVDVCRAVAFAHSKDVLHRDLKGANVVVGDFGEVFLLDWGLAKAAGEADVADDATVTDGESTDLTAAGSIVGTPAYLAPELATGSDATKASDIYGLGAMLYALLTDHAPYSGTSVSEVLDRVKASDPKTIADWNPTAPKPLIAVCRKAMARSPGDRYPSAEALATEIRRFLADEPVLAYAEPWPARVARWAKRRKAAVIGAAVVGLTALVASTVAAGLIWTEQQRTKTAWTSAEVSQKAAEANADAAVLAVRDLTNFVRASETVGGQAPNDAQRKKALVASIGSYDRLAELRPDDSEVRYNLIRLNRFLANLCRIQNEHAEAEAAYKAALALCDTAIATDAGNLPREVKAQTLRDYGVHLQQLGRPAKAYAILADTARVYDEVIANDPTSATNLRYLATVRTDCADLLYQLGRYEEAEADARSAVALSDRLARLPDLVPDPLDPIFATMADTRLGMVLRERGRPGDAIASLGRGIDRLAPLAKANPNRDLQFQLHRARAERGWTAAAVPDLDAAIAGMETLARQYPAIPVYALGHAYSRLYRGKVLAAKGQTEPAKADLAVAATLLETLAAKSPAVPSYAAFLGQTRTQLGQLAATPAEANGQFTKAKAALDKAIELNPDSAAYRKAREDLVKAMAKAG